MTEGFVAIDRGIFDHPFFAREEFTEREAWIWMIAAASWKQNHKVKRGQLIYSIRFLASKWGWHRSRTHRFLKRLKTETMIETGKGIITICNYEHYQSSAKIDETPSRDTCETQARQKRDLLETRNKEPQDIFGASRQPSDERFEEFWRVYPRRDGPNPKAPARKLFDGFLKNGVDCSAIIAGARSYGEKEREKVGTPYIAQAQTWLRQRRWEDYTGNVASLDARRKELLRLEITYGTDSPQVRRHRELGKKWLSNGQKL